MTPFYQLGHMQKAANSPPQGYQYQQGNHGLKNPFAEYEPVPGSQAEQAHQNKQWAEDGGPANYFGGGGTELVADMAAGTNPFTGVPYYGAKAYMDAKNGRWGHATLNTLFGAASFIPGGGTAGALIKGGIKGLLGLGAKGAVAAAGKTGGRLAAAQAGSKAAVEAAKNAPKSWAAKSIAPNLGPNKLYNPASWSRGNVLRNSTLIGGQMQMGRMSQDMANYQQPTNPYAQPSGGGYGGGYGGGGYGGGRASSYQRSQDTRVQNGFYRDLAKGIVGG